ncbi:MAG: hypothetical protein GYA15_07265 [Leptolinea sp.]|jgi:hypothetical protein|nr:hypothetical protein [Leptolinea sp.]
MSFTLESALGTILDDPHARIVIDRYIPGASSNPMLGMFRNTTINTLLSMPQAWHMGITRKQAEELLAEINKSLS